MANGVDLSVTKNAQKAADTQETKTFEVIAREWHGKFAPFWVANHADKIIRRFELYVFLLVGSKQIKSITAPELLAVLRRIEAKGILETAHRTQQNCGRVFAMQLALLDGLNVIQETIYALHHWSLFVQGNYGRQNRRRLTLKLWSGEYRQKK